MKKNIYLLFIAVFLNSCISYQPEIFIADNFEPNNLETLNFLGRENRQERSITKKMDLMIRKFLEKKNIDLIKSSDFHMTYKFEFEPIKNEVVDIERKGDQIVYKTHTEVHYNRMKLWVFIKQNDLVKVRTFKSKTILEDATEEQQFSALSHLIHDSLGLIFNKM